MAEESLFSLFTDNEDLCNCILSYLEIPSIYLLELSNRFFHEQLQQVNTDRCVFGNAVFRLASRFCDGFILEKEYFDGFKWGSGFKSVKFRKVLQEFYNNTFSRVGFRSDTLVRVNNQLEQSTREHKYIEIVKWMPCLLLHNLFRVAYNDIKEKFKHEIFHYLIDYSKANWKTSHRDLKRVSIRKLRTLYPPKYKNSTFLESISDGKFLLHYLDSFKSLKTKYESQALIYHRSSTFDKHDDDTITEVEQLISMETHLQIWPGLTGPNVSASSTISKTLVVGGISKKMEEVNLEQEISELYLELFGLTIPQVYESKNGRIAYNEKNQIFVVFPFYCDRLSVTDKHNIH